VYALMCVYIVSIGKRFDVCANTFDFHPRRTKSKNGKVPD
jgi:uncharacterized UPF0160 family protein